MTPKLSSYRPGRWAAALAVVALLSVVFNIRPDNSPHKWTEFETVAGQPYPVPKHWLATPSGRLTHNLKLPDAMPKPVPFNFTLAYLKALVPFTDSVGDQYWQHLCATESGQYIFKTVKPVEGLALMRISTVTPKQEDEADLDNWMYEAGFLEITMDEGYHPASLASRYIQWPLFTYRHAEIPNRDGTQWQRFSRLVDEPLGDRIRIEEAVALGKWTESQLDAPSERYAVTWRGLVRPLDRRNRIAGFEILVFDRLSGEVLAVLRNFQHGWRTWRNAAGCPQMYSNFTDPANSPEVMLALRTIQPSSDSAVLRSIDERISRRNHK